jgi:hypothetical protein
MGRQYRLALKTESLADFCLGSTLAYSVSFRTLFLIPPASELHLLYVLILNCCQLRIYVRLLSYAIAHNHPFLVAKIRTPFLLRFSLALG